MISCPNKNHPDWVKTVNKYGEKKAHLAWNILHNEDLSPAGPINEVAHGLKSVQILISDKAKQVFAKGEKNNWPLDKILTELQVPKDQKSIILDKDITNREEIITSLLAENSFVVEVNTAKTTRLKDNLLDSIPNSFEDDFGNSYTSDYSNTQEGFDYFNNGKIITKLEYDEAYLREQNDSQDDENTSHYSNLTVPGGTNYQENEISTPDIIPNIKGHAAFSTDKGIGWFRSDEKVTSTDAKLDAKQREKNELRAMFAEFEGDTDEANTRRLANELQDTKGTATKTRRVLEVQSDLFQKGRDRINLTSDLKNKLGNSFISKENGKKYEVLYTGKILENGVTKGLAWFEVDINNGSKIKQIKESDKDSLPNDFFEYGKTLKNTKPSNDFLQLLNKKGNWVNFFIQSIVQDSVKKGYEKVLFPTGETAAKVEGHETIAEEIITIEKGILNPENYHQIDESGHDYGFEYRIRDFVVKGETKEEFITNLKEYRDNLKTQGLEKLKPVEAFYTNRVTNILNKLYTVKQITDEYGNTWNEVDLETNKKSADSTIFFNKTINKFNKKSFSKSPKELTKTELRSLMSIPYGNVSDQQVINAKTLIERFNGLFNTSHRLESTRIGSALTFNVNFVVDHSPRNQEAYNQRQKAKLNPDNPMVQGSLFNSVSAKDIRNKKKEANDKANKRLSKLMTSLGIDLKVQKSLIAEYGEGINGVADLLNKVIKVNDKKYIPEEASHFLIAMLDNSPYKKGLFNLARQSKLYKEVYDEYMAIYKNEEKVAEEVAGKLLAQAFINIEAESINRESPTLKRRLSTLADIIWSWLQKTFTPSIKNEIQNIYNELAEKIYAGTIVLSASNILGGGKFFNAESVNNLNKTKVSHKILKESIKRIQNEINILKKQLSKTELAESITYQGKENLLATLQGKLVDKEYINGIYNFLDEMKSEMLGTPSPDNAAMSSFISKIAKLNDQIEDGTITNNEAAKQIKELHTHFSSYKPVLDLINSSFNTKEFQKELTKAGLTAEDVNKLKIEVNTLQGQIGALKSEYHKMIKKILTRQYLTHTKEDKENLVFDSDGNLKSLSVAFKDETSFTRWLTAMAESHDAGLRIVDVIVKKSKEKARETTLNEKIDILNEFDRLSAKGVKLDIVETDKGVPTGYYMSDLHRGKFMKAFEKQRANVEAMKKAGMGSQDVANSWYAWKLEHGSFENPDAKLYHNSEWSKLSKEQRDYLDRLREFKGEKLDKLPTGSRAYWMIPQFRKDLMERARASGFSGAFNTIKQSIIDSFVIREDDTEYGNQYTDILGQDMHFLPLYGNTMLENLAELSTDITSSTISYASFANDHIEMQKIIHTIEIAKDVFKERDVLTGKVSKEDYENMDMDELLSKYSHISGEASKSFQRFSTYSEMQVYGKYKEPANSSTFKFFGKEVSITKIFDFIAKYTALNTLAVNIYPIINNVILGRSLEFMEGIVGEYFSNKYLYSADKELLNPKILGDVGKKVNKTKVMVWAEYMDVLQDYEQNIRNTNADRKTRFGQLMQSSPHFAGSHIGEFNIQMRASIGFAKSIKLIDSNGKETNLYNAYTVKDGKLVLNGKFKIKEANRLFSENRVGTYLTNDDKTNFIFTQANLNQKLHGIYNKLDRNAFQQKATGGLVMLFRKFLVPAIQRRYKVERFNEMSGQQDEGYYQTLFHFLKSFKSENDKAKTLLRGILSSKNLSKDELRQVQNLRRAGLDIAFALALIVFTNLMLDDDDEKPSWAKSMLAYQAHRLFTEITAFMPAHTIVSEGTKLLASPSAAVSQLENISSFLNELLNITSYGETIQSGQYKGYTRLGKRGSSLIPGFKTVKSWFHPDEKVKYFYRN